MENISVFSLTSAVEGDMREILFVDNLKEKRENITRIFQTYAKAV